MAEPDPSFQQERLAKLDAQAQKHALFPYLCGCCFLISAASIFSRENTLVGGIAFLGFIGCAIGSLKLLRVKREITRTERDWEKLGFYRIGGKFMKGS
jgi:hypothetical protein